MVSCYRCVRVWKVRRLAQDPVDFPLFVVTRMPDGTLEWRSLMKARPLLTIGKASDHTGLLSVTPTSDPPA